MQTYHRTACMSSFCRKEKAWRKKASSESGKELQEKCWRIGEMEGLESFSWKIYLNR